jgi:hypothetical protein
MFIDISKTQVRIGIQKINKSEKQNNIIVIFI